MAGKRRLIWHIFPWYLFIIVVALVAVTGYASISIKKYFLRQAESDLKVRALLFEEQIINDLIPLRAAVIDLQCKKVGKRSSTRITVILPDGKVVGDSESDPRTMDNHADRPEFIETSAGTMGSSVRHSLTLNKRFMYVGIPVRMDNNLIAVIRTSVPLDVIDQAINKIQNKIIIGGLIIAILAAIVSLIVSRHISQPIEKLKQGASRFSEGDFQYRIPPSNIEEIWELNQAIKDMALDLHKRINANVRQRHEMEAILSSMAEGVIAVDSDERVISMNNAAAFMLGCDASEAPGRSIQEVVRNTVFQEFVKKTLMSTVPVEEDFGMFAGKEQFVNAHGTVLRDADENRIGALIVLNDITRLRRLENIRKEFVANVSHEIKTPITAIKGFVETLNEGSVKDQQDTKRFLEIIGNHAKRLEAIIEDLLSLSKIEKETETEEIKLTHTSIKDVLRTAVQVCEAKAKAKDITIEVECDQELIAKINPALLEQAVVNLLDNAVKYSDKHGTVRIIGLQDDQETTIQVIDEGRGIDKEHLPRLFERFYRVDKARSRQLGGTGLGLAIVKHIAQAHKGRVSVESEVGKGSTFSIYLPRIA